MQKSTILVDFDNTLAQDAWPFIGAPVPMAIETIKALQEQGHKIILHTMRGDDAPIHKSDGRSYPTGKADYLSQAIRWCKERGLEFWDVNGNKSQKHWTTSPKTYGHYRIDDNNACCPLNQIGDNQCVNWFAIQHDLMQRGYLPDGAFERGMTVKELVDGIV